MDNLLLGQHMTRVLNTAHGEKLHKGKTDAES